MVSNPATPPPGADSEFKFKLDLHLNWKAGFKVVYRLGS
jgi:hypothetical protein